jgi:superoxide dismutase, Cu-Zn family
MRSAVPAKYHLFAVLALGAGATAVGAAAGRQFASGPGVPVGAVIHSADGRTVGSLRVEDEGDHRVRLTVDAKDLPPGWHGFHVHGKGVCDPKSRDPKTGSPFASAGAHLDLGSHSHPEHSGDLPSLLIGADGTGHAAVVTDRFPVSRLLSGEGTAIIIHALPDNQANIPKRYAANGPDAETLKTGDSGKRLACGVITKR